MRKINKDINIFVACHKDSYVPENRYLIPIQVGAEIAGTKLDMIGDDTGDNISRLNLSFCELTAQYWAWKNVDCEYYGFCHYRRFFSFADFIGSKRTAYSDLNLDSMTDNVLEQLNIREDFMEKTIKSYDIILPCSAKLRYDNSGFNTVYKHYKGSAHHNIEDLDAAVKIIHELYPDFDKYVKRTLRGNKTYFLNMYIMKKKYFFEYCEWLFPILMKFHEQKNYADCSVYEIRTPGLLAERLVQVFMLYLKDKYKNLKVCELQNTFFKDTENPYPVPINENKIGICLASSDVYAKHLGVALQSIADNGSDGNFYDIVIFDNGISYSNKDLLIKTVCKKKNFSLKFLKTSDYLKNRKLSERGHITKSSYLRFAILDLMRNYSKVIYLDCDLVVNKDIAELYSVDLGDDYVAAVRDTVMGTWNNLHNSFGEKQREYNKKVLGLTDLYGYFNAGVLILNIDILKKHITTDELFKMATSKFYQWQDQDVLNEVCKGRVHYLPSNWNYMPHVNAEAAQLDELDAPKYIYQDYLAAKRDPYVVHFAGHYQPIYVRNVDSSEIYWKYARRSNFYEQILAELFDNNLGRNLPFKTKLMNKLKKMFPKGTRRGNFARSVYRLMKKLKLF